MAVTLSLSLPPLSGQHAASPALGDGVLMEAAAVGVGCTMPRWLQTAVSPVRSEQAQGDGEMSCFSQRCRTQPCKHMGCSMARHSLPTIARSLSEGTRDSFHPSVPHINYLCGLQCLQEQTEEALGLK